MMSRRSYVAYTSDKTPTVHYYLGSPSVSRPPTCLVRALQLQSTLQLQVMVVSPLPPAESSSRLQATVWLLGHPPSCAPHPTKTTVPNRSLSLRRSLPLLLISLQKAAAGLGGAGTRQAAVGCQNMIDVSMPDHT